MNEILYIHFEKPQFELIKEPPITLIKKKDTQLSYSMFNAFSPSKFVFLFPKTSVACSTSITGLRFSELLVSLRFLF